MDLTKAINNQANRIIQMDDSIPVESIVTHLERAEFLYNLGLENNDENFFTDVIYRTNQVFEGSLRIAYMVLNDKTESQASKKRTVDIEDYFTNESILKERVLEQFTNYRKEWRNPSTHDFKLIFNESESVLAISNVSAFTYVLFNQVIQKLSFNIELAKVSKFKKSIAKLKSGSDSDLEYIGNLLIKFNNEHKELLNKEFVREYEIIGALTAFLTMEDEFHVQTELLLKVGTRRAHIDLLIEYKAIKYVIELKRPGMRWRREHEAQVHNYISLLKIKDGILFIPNGKRDVELKYTQPSIFGDGDVTLIN